ncbi:MAG: hypothetical protein NC301_08675 [Bacteroides sp.]|nr:hypothetical protein [Bacteroides sp.]MCM1380231.1 hypothetical protein [Bacteroides sp.]MCM1446539.1 hypothetical protein [Prevotella sp.]
MTATAATTSQAEKLQTFRAPATVWWQAIAYCLMLALVGLKLYPMLLPIAIFLMWRWRNDRYAFLVEATLLLGGFGLISPKTIPATDVALVLGIVGAIIYRKNAYVKRVTLATLAYFVAIVLIAMTSIESMSVQFYRMRQYFSIITYFIPLLAFVNRPFVWDKFRDSFIIHTLVICGFYVVDTFIFNGYILLPGALPGSETSIFEPALRGFMSLPRHYPTGLYLLVPFVIWINYKQVRFSTIQWVMILLAIFASRTNSLLFALIGCWIVFRPNKKQILTYGLVAAGALICGYFVDNATGRNLRLADNLDQFVSLEAAQDDEDLAEFGTGRMAQIIPKWELLNDLDRTSLGFGFIHPKKTTNPIFQIRNDLYSDESMADEVATEVEVTQVQTIFDIGFVGFTIQLIYFIGVYFIIRKLTHSRDYLNVIEGVTLLGVGGFAGLNGPGGLILVGLILGTILLANKPLSLKPQPDERQ